MTNLPIAASNSQPSVNVAGPAQKNDAADEQPANPFGAVLARQMDEADNPASNTPSPASGVGNKTATASASQADKAEQDKVSATTNVSGDPASILAAMLQLPQEIKTPAVKDAEADATAGGIGTGKTGANRPAINADATQAGTRSDIAAAASGKTDAAIMAADAAIEAAGKMAVQTGANRPAINTGPTQADTKFGTATAASGKTDAAIMAADAVAAAARKMSGMALRNGSNPEIGNSAESPTSSLSAAQSAQSIAQSTGSMAASGISPAILQGDKTANGLQTISSPLGSSNWADEFSQKISWMGAQRNQVAELHLNPPNLGPLDVVLKISDNQATALFTSPHSAVRDAVENALPRLREALADNGIMLGNATVSDQSSRGHGTEWYTNQDSATAAQRETSNDLFNAPGLSPAAAQIVPMRRHNGMVDTFA